MMIKLGFDERWVALAMEIVITALYSVLLNDEPKGFIKPTRGMKQRDTITIFIPYVCRRIVNHAKKS